MSSTTPPGPDPPVHRDPAGSNVVSVLPQSQESDDRAAASPSSPSSSSAAAVSVSTLTARIRYLEEQNAIMQDKLQIMSDNQYDYQCAVAELNKLHVKVQSLEEENEVLRSVLSRAIDATQECCPALKSGAQAKDEGGDEEDAADAHVDGRKATHESEVAPRAFLRAGLPGMPGGRDADGKNQSFLDQLLSRLVDIFYERGDESSTRGGTISSSSASPLVPNSRISKYLSFASQPDAHRSASADDADADPPQPKLPGILFRSIKEEGDGGGSFSSDTTSSEDDGGDQSGAQSGSKVVSSSNNAASNSCIHPSLPPLPIMMPTPIKIIKDAHGGALLQSLCVCDAQKRIYTAGSDKKIRVHDALTGASVNTIPVGNLALSMDITSHYLFAGCADRVARFYDVNTMRALELAGHSEKIVSACLSASAQHGFTASSDSTIKLWDIRRQAALKTLSCSSTANDVCVSGESIYAAHYNGCVTSWDRRTAARTCEVRSHQRIATCVRVSSDGKLCVSLGKDNSVCVRDIRQLTRTLCTMSPPSLNVALNWSRLSISPDSRVAAVGTSQGQVLLLELPYLHDMATATSDGTDHTSGYLENQLRDDVWMTLKDGHAAGSAVTSTAWGQKRGLPMVSVGEDGRIVLWGTSEQAKLSKSFSH